MLKELFDRIREYKDIQTVEIDGRTYTNHLLKWVNPDVQDEPAPLRFSTLSGLADYFDTENTARTYLDLAPADEDDGKPKMTNPDFMPGPTPRPVVHIKGDIENNYDYPLVQVCDYSRVRIIGGLKPENHNSRFCYAEAVMVDKGYQFGQWQALENFIIALQSQFVQTPVVDEIIGYLGNLANSHVVENTDDGFSQSINIKTGITTKAKVKLTNPVHLQPYRTFREILQPKSACVIRVRDTKDALQCSLYEADGNSWKVESVQGIADWLNQRIPDAIVLA